MKHIWVNASWVGFLGLAFLWVVWGDWLVVAADAENQAVTPPEPAPSKVVKTEFPKYMTLVDFADVEIGKFPGGWRSRGGNALQEYRVVGSAEGKYLKGIDDGSKSIQVFKEVKWDVKEFPILEWKWRAHILPEGGNEQKSEKNDSAAALYVIFPRRIFLPEILKYVWSTTLPEGAEATSGRGITQVYVVESGTKGLGQWVVERRNIFEDYKARFGREPSKAVAIGFLTDSNATGSRAEADYAWVRALPAPPPDPS